MLLIALSSFVSGALLYVLARRMESAEREILEAWSGLDDSDIGLELRSFCQAAVAVDLLPAATGPGVSALPVRYRDHGDKFVTVGELLREIRLKCASHSYGDTLRLVRMFYQLDYSLDASPEVGEKVLHRLEKRLVANDGSRKIGLVRRVSRGQRCDTETMTPVRSGSHVEQPLGFIVYSQENRILGKADVLCR